MDKPDYCPTQGGTYRAYVPEWRHDKKWVSVPVEYRNQRPGVPGPALLGGISYAVGLYGWAQANALAWMFAAESAAVGKEIEVRVVEYEVLYDIKARRIDPEPEQVTTDEEVEA